MEERPPAATSLRVAGGVQFVAPDPCAIFINQVRLDEHLQATGLKTPLRLRPFLEGLSFAEFETSYRPGDRPPYALRAIEAMVSRFRLVKEEALREAVEDATRGGGTTRPGADTSPACALRGGSAAS